MEQEHIPAEIYSQAYSRGDMTSLQPSLDDASMMKDDQIDKTFLEGQHSRRDPEESADDAPAKKRRPMRRMISGISSGVSEERKRSTTVVKALPTIRDHTTDQLGPGGDEYIIREYDEAGEKKVDLNGVLQDGRMYKCKTFYVPNRGQKLFMLATECARVLGYRDSYLLFNKNRTLYKIIAPQDEKDHLISQDILPFSYRSRQIAIVTARSIFRQFGSRVIVGGRRVRDDYWEEKARKQGFTEDDLAVEKRPGAAKVRDAAAAEASANASALMHHQVDIADAQAPAHFGHPQPQTLGMLPPAGAAISLPSMQTGAATGEFVGMRSKFHGDMRLSGTTYRPPLYISVPCEEPKLSEEAAEALNTPHSVHRHSLSPVFSEDFQSVPIHAPSSSSFLLCSTSNTACKNSSELENHKAMQDTSIKCKHDDCRRSKHGFTRKDNYQQHLRNVHGAPRNKASSRAKRDPKIATEVKDLASASLKGKTSAMPPLTAGIGSSPDASGGLPMEGAGGDDTDVEMIEANPFSLVTRKRDRDESPVCSSPAKRQRSSSCPSTRIPFFPVIMRSSQEWTPQPGAYDSLHILERNTYDPSLPVLHTLQSSMQEGSSLPPLEDILVRRDISHVHDTPSSPPDVPTEPSPIISDDLSSSQTPPASTPRGISYIRQRRGQRSSPSVLLGDDTDTETETARLLPHPCSPTLSSTSSTNWSHRSAGFYGGTSPQDAGSPSSTGSSGNKSGAASTNTANTSVSAWSGHGPNNVAGQSQGQIPSPNGTGTNQPAAGGSGDPSPGGFSILIGFLKADPALMMLFDLMLLAGFGCQIGACVSYFKDEYQRGDGHPTDPDFLSLFAGFWLQMAGLYIILFGIFKFADRYLRWWLISMTVLSLLLSGGGLGFYFLYTTVGDTLMWFGGLAQNIWTFKMIAFHRKRDVYIPRGSPAPPIGSPIPLTGVQSRGPCHCK